MTAPSPVSEASVAAREEGRTSDNWPIRCCSSPFGRGERWDWCLQPQVLCRRGRRSGPYSQPTFSASWRGTTAPIFADLVADSISHRPDLLQHRVWPCQVARKLHAAVGGLEPWLDRRVGFPWLGRPVVVALLACCAVLRCSRTNGMTRSILPHLSLPCSMTERWAAGCCSQAPFATSRRPRGCRPKSSSNGVWSQLRLGGPHECEER